VKPTTKEKKKKKKKVEGSEVYHWVASRYTPDVYLPLRISHGSGGNGPALMAAAVAVIIQLVSATLRERAHNALALFGRHG
jgi:hypothetical protein